MELNREQIIKALELHSQEAMPCLEKCAYGGMRYCGSAMAKDALSLIKELTEEVVDLKAIAEGYQKQFEDCAEDRARLTEENEMLRTPRFISYPDGSTELIPSVESVRADTVRKMHSEIKDRCIKGGIYPAFVARTIDQIAKEMIGEGND